MSLRVHQDSLPILVEGTATKFHPPAPPNFTRRAPLQRGPADNSAQPNPWAPVPQSRTISVPSSPRTSTHDVLPP